MGASGTAMNRSSLKSEVQVSHGLSLSAGDSQKISHLLVIYLSLALVVFIAFEQVRRNEFVNYDDQVYVTQNKHVLSGLSGENIRWAFTSGYASNWHPLTWLSHIVDCELFGPNPYRHHLTNLFFHIASTLVLFTVLRKMSGKVFFSGFVAAAFGLHPMHVESVAWIAERKDVLSGFFWMLTMWAYVYYVEQPKFAKYALMFFLFVLGLMAKPMVVTLPFVLLLLDYWPLRRFGREKVFYLVIEKIPLFLLSVISSWITFVVQSESGTVRAIEALSVTARIANASIAYVQYIEKMIWPSRLAVFYPHAGEKVAIWQAVIAGALLLSITIFVIRYARKYGYLLTGWLWYLGTLVPVIGLVQVGDQALADRYSYIPFTGLFIIIGSGLNDILSKWRYRRIILGALVTIALSASLICTRFQVLYWRNSVRLCEHAIDVTEDNFSVYSGLGDALKSQGRLDEAIGSYYKALEGRAKDERIHNNLANALREQGRLGEAVGHYYKALQSKPDYAVAHNNLGEVLKIQGEVDEAIQQFNLAKHFDPDYAEAYGNLGDCFFKTGKIDDAIECYSKAVELEPDNPSSHCNLGNVLAISGRLTDAVERYKMSLEIRPNDAKTLSNLGNALLGLERLEEAEAKYIESLKIGVDNAVTHLNLGICLQKQGRFDEAEREYNIVLSIDPQYEAARRALDGLGKYRQGSGK